MDPAEVTDHLVTSTSTLDDPDKLDNDGSHMFNDHGFIYIIEITKIVCHIKRDTSIDLFNISSVTRFLFCIV